MLKIFITLLSLTLSPYISQASEVNSIEDSIFSNNGEFLNSEEENRLSAFESEIKTLTGKMEALEHNIKGLEDKISSLELLISKLNSIAENNKALPNSSKTSHAKGDKNSKNAAENEIGKGVKNPTSKQASKDSAKNTDINNISAKNTLATPNNKALDLERADYDAALLSLKENKLEDAENKFTKFIEKYPNSKLIGNAYFWNGESFYRRNKFDKAALAYLKGYKQDSKGTKAGDALLKLAMALGEINKIPEACTTLEKLNREFPNRSDASKKRAKETSDRLGCSKKPAE